MTSLGLSTLSNVVARAVRATDASNPGLASMGNRADVATAFRRLSILFPGVRNRPTVKCWKSPGVSTPKRLMAAGWSGWGSCGGYYQSPAYW